MQISQVQECRHHNWTVSIEPVAVSFKVKNQGAISYMLMSVQLIEYGEAHFRAFQWSCFLKNDTTTHIFLLPKHTTYAIIFIKCPVDLEVSHFTLFFLHGVV